MFWDPTLFIRKYCGQLLTKIISARIGLKKKQRPVDSGFIYHADSADISASWIFQCLLFILNIFNHSFF